MAEKQRLLTGLKPSGTLHLGNYFGALKPFIDTYKDFDSFLMVADYHALISAREPEVLRRDTINIVKDYLAAGIDPTQAVIFKQSDILEHHELAWIFECLVTVPFLMLAHAYKDRTGKGEEVTVGLFNYPMLMAADILLYDTTLVPVGEDQRQHVEYAREAATKFHNAYGETFILPKEKILPNIGTVPGTDGRKMSKSYGNIIPLFGTKEEITKAVMGIVTDSAGDTPEYVYAIHALVRPENELQEIYAANKGQYKALKEILIEDIEAFVAPMRARREAITDEEVREVIEQGNKKARAIAEAKMREVRQKIGITI